MLIGQQNKTSKLLLYCACVSRKRYEKSLLSIPSKYNIILKDFEMDISGLFSRTVNLKTPKYLGLSECVYTIRRSISDGPSHVRIKGPDEAKQGDTVVLSCETDRSNPPSTIKWTVAGEPEKNSTSIVVSASQSSWITKSNVSFVIPNGQHSVIATCQAFSNNAIEKVITTHKVSVLCKYKPLCNM